VAGRHPAERPGLVHDAAGILQDARGVRGGGPERDEVVVVEIESEAPDLREAADVIERIELSAHLAAEDLAAAERGAPEPRAEAVFARGFEAHGWQSTSDARARLGRLVRPVAHVCAIDRLVGDEARAKADAVVEVFRRK